MGQAPLSIINTPSTIGSGMSSPQAVAVDGSGNVYIVDAGNSRVLKETLSGGSYTQSTIVDASSGYSGGFGVAVDGSGNVYLSDNQNHRVLKETPGGGGYTQSVVASSTGMSPLGVAVDNSGNVYVADSTSENVLLEVPASGGGYQQSALPHPNGGNPFGVTLDASGNIYVSDIAHNSVWKESAISASNFTMNTIITVVIHPEGLAVDGLGNVYIAAEGANHATKETLSGGTYTKNVLPISLLSPSGVAMDPSGKLYIADTGNNRVVELYPGATDFGALPVGTASATVSFTVTFTSTSSINPPAVLTQGAAGLDFTEPTISSCDPGANPYSAGDTCTVDVTFKPAQPGIRSGAVVLSDATTGNPIATAYLLGTGVGPQIGFIPLGGNAIHVSDGHLNAVALDAAGDVYFTDNVNGVAGVMYAVGNGYSGSVLIASGLTNPTGVAVDGAGNVYIAEGTGGNALVTETLSGGAWVQSVTSLGGPVWGVAVDGSGNVYVALDHAVEKGTTSNMSTTIASGFSSLRGIAVDGSGNVFVTDNGSASLYKETLGSNGGYTQSQITSGPGPFASPMGVALGVHGDIYVADSIGLIFEGQLVGGNYEWFIFDEGKNPTSITLDSRGNVYFCDSDIIIAVNLATPPPLVFDPSAIGTQSNESPRAVVVNNTGNADLVFSAPALSGAAFALDDGSTNCYSLSPSSPATGPVPPGGVCGFGIDFTPTVLDLNSGTLTLNDNASDAQQTISLSGTGSGVAPSISAGGNPLNQTLNAGQLATFTATATGNPTPTVQWQVSTGGGPFTNVPGAGSTTLSFTATAAMNGNQYQAVFTNSAGSATTSAATLTVQSAPSIRGTGNPASLTVNAGQTAMFTAAASGVPTPTVQWQVSTGGGPFTNVPGGSSNTLSFTTTAAMNGNQYQAVFTNAVGSATTSAATLTVQSAPSITGTGNPASLTVNAGQTAMFTAAASGIPTPTVQWQVSAGGGPFTNVPGGSSNTLSFTATSAMNGNQYQAVFTNSVGSAATTAATLTVQSPPSITATGNPSNVTVPAGQTAMFTAAANGIPTPTVQWQVSTNGGPFTNVPGGSFTTLSFNANDGLTGNQYRAVFTNLAGSATTTAATLTVQDFTITATPPSQIIPSGHQAEYIISLASLRGLAGSVALSCSGGPPNSTCSINPGAADVNGAATAALTLLPPMDVNHGTFTLTFTGTLDGIVHSANVSLTVK